MVVFTKCRWPCFALLCLSLLAGQSLGQQAKTAADYFPATTAIFLEVDQPGVLIDKVTSHPVVEYVSELKQVKQAIRSPQFAMGMLAMGLIESQIEEPLLDAIKTNLSEGVFLGVDTETNGLAILFESSDEANLRRLAGTVLNVVANGAKQAGDDVPFEKKDYREAVAAEFDDFLIARYKTWFVVTNKPKLAKVIVDNMIDGAKTSLSDQEWFKQARKQNSSADVWAAVDLETLRSAGVAPDLFKGKTDNPGAELILGGLFDALKHAPVASGKLNLNENLELSLAVPFDIKWATTARRFFFGEEMGGFAPTPLLPENMVANLVSYRDIADWWLSKEDLFEENVIAQLAQADSQLSTIFSGMDFGQDVLGALQPGVQIVVTENSFDDKYVPDVKFPSFAMVGKLRDPEKIRRKLKIAFQSVIGFVNINLGQQGQPQLDLETETIGDAKISAAQYYYDDQTEEGLMLFNFSPTIAFQGPYFIVASSRDLAVELAELAGKKTAENNSAKSPPTNTRLDVDAAVLSRILKENRESLIAQNMLEEGHSRKEAKEAIEIVLAVADFFKDGQLDFQVKPDEMRLNLQLRVNQLNAVSNQ